MKKLVLIAMMTMGGYIGLSGNGYAMAVFDSSNLAQNMITAQEAVRQTQQQIQMLTTQLNQYKRMLQDAMNPGSWGWGIFKIPSTN